MYAELKQKKCSKCGKVKATTEFYSSGKSKGNKPRPECKKCTDKQNRTYLKTENGKKAIEKSKQRIFSDPEKLKRYKEQQAFSARKKKYGIDVDMFVAMLKSQNYKCGICPEQVHAFSSVDHCHKTGKIRMILCNLCNTGLGMFKDDPALLLEAKNYLEKFKK